MDDQNSLSILPGFVIPPGLSSLVLVLALCGPAHAEQRGTGDETSAVRKAPDIEVAPRGERAIRETKYGDWRKVCFKTPETKMVCRTTISGTWDTGQTMVRADLIERENEGSPRLQLFLPVGLYLPAGVKVKADEGTQYQIPYVWCLTNTCIAADVADPSLIHEMETGKKLQVEVVDSSVLTVTTSLPLDQFAVVHKSWPSQIYQQDIDQ